MRDEYLGLFAHLLHIPPPTVDELLIDDFERLVLWIDQHQAQAQQQSGGD